MTLDAKALETALNAAAKVYASQNRREPPTPSDIEGTAEDLRSPINAFLGAADLVERKTLDANTLGHMVDEKLFHLEAERDEALSLAETQGRHVAALREALNQISARYDHTILAAQQMTAIARAALTDTAEAAARYRLVDDEHVVVPKKPTAVMQGAGAKIRIVGAEKLPLGCDLAWHIYDLMLAAAPAAKGEAGEGTECSHD